jgi:hypothetical protein
MIVSDERDSWDGVIRNRDIVRHYCNSADYLGDDMVMLKED